MWVWCWCVGVGVGVFMCGCGVGVYVWVLGGGGWGWGVYDFRLKKCSYMNIERTKHGGFLLLVGLQLGVLCNVEKC